ncbi:MAG: NYN domain-containing protein [Cyanobacteria bacterium P01_D01_bin.115]
MDSRTPRIALLIDADNASASKIDLVFSRLEFLGTIRVRRAYGNWKKDHLQGWAKILHKHAIVPIQQFDYVTGKNATDIALAIDAMDLLQTMRPEIFGIVAGDSDYTPLVVRLIASGAQVFGFGQVKTAAIAFQEACTEFVSLDNDAGKSPIYGHFSTGNNKHGVAVPSLEPVDTVALTVVDSSLLAEAAPTKVFVEAIKQNQQSTGWADVKSIGAYLSQRKIVKAAYNVNRWASYYKKFPVMFEVQELDGKTMVRLLSEK